MVKEVSDHCPILTSLSMTTGGNRADSPTDSSIPPRVLFHTARLKDEEVRKRFTYMVDRASVEQQPHLAEMKGKFSRGEISAAELISPL